MASNPKPAPSLLDIRSDPRLTSLMDLLASLHRTADPRDAMPGLIASMRSGPGDRAFIHIVRDDHRHVIRRSQRIDGGPSPISADISPLAELLSTPTPKVAQNLDFPPYRSAIALPIFTGDAADDWIVLLDQRADGLGLDDLRELLVRMHLIAVSSNSLRIERQLFQANLKIQNELENLATIQRGLLPEQIPDIPGLQIAASYESVAHAGGDIYDFVPLGQRPGHPVEASDQRFAILLGDVAGHGAPAAIVMAMLHAILHAYPNQPTGPAEVLSFANVHLATKRIRQTFVTAFLGFYDPATRMMTYTRAGQTPALLASPDGSIRYLDAVGDLPLGLVAEETFTQAAIQLEPGQLLLLYTDGITEAKGDSAAMFETAGLEAALRPFPSTPQQAINAILAGVAKHSDGRLASDDRTLVALRVM